MVSGICYLLSSRFEASAVIHMCRRMVMHACVSSVSSGGEKKNATLQNSRRCLDGSFGVYFCVAGWGVLWCGRCQVAVWAS